MPLSFSFNCMAIDWRLTEQRLALEIDKVLR